jgi:F0F1-type ATP synthase epsilon subunit
MADAQPTPPNPPVKPQDDTSNNSEEKIHVRVRNRTQLLFDDDVTAVTSKNDTGIFDVLPEHANFISLITSPLVLRKLDGQNQEIPFTNGIIKVKDNAVYCYIDLISKEASIAPSIPTALTNKGIT